MDDEKTGKKRNKKSKRDARDLMLNIRKPGGSEKGDRSKAKDKRTG